VHGHELSKITKMLHFHRSSVEEKVKKRSFFVTLITVGVAVSINILYLFCGIFNDNFSSSHYVASDYEVVKYCR